MRTCDGMFQEFAAALQFPYYFGNNMNAFRDCMTDLDWLDGSSFTIVIFDAHLVMCNEASDDRDAFWKTVTEICAVWAVPVEEGQPWDRPAKPLHFLLQGSEVDGQALMRQLLSAPVG